MKRGYLDGFNIEVNMEDMFSAPYSEGDLMKLLCSNNDKIKQMTQDEFCSWFKEEISKEEKHEIYQPMPYETIKKRKTKWRRQHSSYRMIDELTKGQAIMLYKKALEDPNILYEIGGIRFI